MDLHEAEFDARVKTKAFIAEHVLPLEADSVQCHENIALPAETVREAKAAGLWAPQAPTERGGMGLPVRGWALCMKGGDLFLARCFKLCGG